MVVVWNRWRLSCKIRKLERKQTRLTLARKYPYGTGYERRLREAFLVDARDKLAFDVALLKSKLDIGLPVAMVHSR